MAGIPPSDRQLLITPLSGFPIDVAFPAPDQIVAGSVVVSCIPWSGGDPVELRDPVVTRRDRATFMVPLERALAPGSHTLLATAQRTQGGFESIVLDIAVRRPSRPPPLSTPQWIQLDFDADRDGDALPDFPRDLAEFGLASGISAAVDIRMEDWVINEIVARTQAFYTAPNPSGFPNGDPIDLRFSAEPPDAGPYTRICVAGATPEGGSLIGNVLLDPGNSDPSDVACDDYLPSGVFPREVLYYEDEPAFQNAFGPLALQPAGSHPLDLAVLRRGFDRTDPSQMERFEALRLGVETFAQVVASVAAHEAGHAMGLVPPGSPGRGLFGGEDAVQFTHNLTPTGEIPAESFLMNAGLTFGFEDLAGTGGAGLPRIRALNFAYLQGRLLLDAGVDGIYMPPSVATIVPRVVSAEGPPIAVLEVSGSHFRSAAVLTLHGLASYGVAQSIVRPGLDGAPDALVGTLILPGLLPGIYDVEVTNPDGQSATLEGGLEVR